MTPFRFMPNDQLILNRAKYVPRQERTQSIWISEHITECQWVMMVINSHNHCGDGNARGCYCQLILHAVKADGCWDLIARQDHSLFVFGLLDHRGREEKTDNEGVRMVNLQSAGGNGLCHKTTSFYGPVIRFRDNVGNRLSCVNLFHLDTDVVGPFPLYGKKDDQQLNDGGDACSHDDYCGAASI